VGAPARAADTTRAGVRREAGSPAFRAGILRGDVILQVNQSGDHAPGGQPRPWARCPGGTAFLLVARGGQEQFVTVRKE
jgi:S1-C subfamily serine protease